MNRQIHMNINRYKYTEVQNSLFKVLLLSMQTDINAIQMCSLVLLTKFVG